MEKKTPSRAIGSVKRNTIAASVATELPVGSTASTFVDRGGAEAAERSGSEGAKASPVSDATTRSEDPTLDRSLRALVDLNILLPTPPTIEVGRQVVLVTFRFLPAFTARDAGQCPRTRAEDQMFVGVIVLARSMVDLAARVTAFDLDGRMADCEPIADTALQVTDDMLGVAERAVTDDHMAAQRHLVGRQSPDVKVVHVCHELRLGDLLGDRLQINLAGSSFQEDVHSLADDAPGTVCDEGGDRKRK